MRFERGLRSNALKPYTVGYKAPSTDDVNRDHPECHAGGTKDSGTWIEDQSHPSIIELGVRLVPIWTDNKTAFAIINNDNACSLYPPCSAYSCIKIESIGSGFYQSKSGENKVPFVGESFRDYQLELPKPYLYKKEFLMQPAGKNILWKPQEMKLQTTIALWAYGGQQFGDDMHPVVFTLESIRQTTTVKLSFLLTWREQGIFPQIAGQLSKTSSIFQDIFELDQTRTLKESLESGMSIIHLIIGTDDTKQVIKIPYYSYRFANNFIFYRKGD